MFGGDKFTHSILDRQTESNIAGRARIRNGILTGASGTRFISSASEASGCDFLVRESFLDCSSCELICDVFPKLADRLHFEPGNEFWSNRFLWHGDIAKAYPYVGRIVLDAHRRAAREIAEFYDVKEKLYFDMAHVMSWKPGMFMQPHADNAHPDGHDHDQDHRDYSGIIYLNDDYEGGEFYLVAQDVAIRPRRGMLVGITAGWRHEHAVLKVIGGNTRYTIPIFFTRDKAEAYPAALHG